MNKEEIQLKGGESTDTVVRIGNTVRRSMQNNSKFVHSFLQHLEKEHLPYSPRFLGVDDEEREILTFIEGDVPRGLTLNLKQLISCIKMLREFHDAAATFDLCEDQETICHNDFAPWNVIFKDDLPVGIIDFDNAQKGKRVEDVGYFLWTFLNLGNKEITDDKQIGRITTLYNEYGFEQAPNLIDAIINQQERILLFRKEKALAEKDTFSINAIDRIKMEITWVKSNSKKIQNAIFSS